MNLISVIVPIYNVEKFIKKCLDSIVNQTYKNLEIILVDDGSPDSCGKICDEYAQKDNRIKVIHKENGGLVSARNAGLEIATGDYISFIDPDDWIEKEMYEEMIKIAIEKNVDAVRCGHYRDDNETSEEHTCIFTENKLFNFKLDRDTLLDIFLSGKIGPNLWAMIIKKNCYDKIHNNYLTHFLGEDYIYVTELFCVIDSIYFYNKSFYHYYKNTTSMSYSLERAKKNINELIALYSIVISILEKYNCASQILIDDWKVCSFVLIYNKINMIFLQPQKISFVKELLSNNEIYKIIESINIEKLSFWKKIFLNLLKNKKYFALYCFIHFHNSYIENYENGIYRKIIKYKKYCSKKGKKEFYLFNVPTHGNIGDQAILQAERKMLTDCKINFMEIPTTEEKIYFNYLRNNIASNAIIGIHAGGFIGSQWIQDERLANKLVMEFYNHDIIIFPQTIYFKDDEFGKIELEKSIKSFSKARNLTIFTREIQSYNFAKKTYLNANIKLTPDIVLYLEKTNFNVQREKILLCLRNDVERKLTNNQKDEITNLVNSYGNYSFIDTVINKKLISKSNQKREVVSKLKEISSAKFVITDRLHGMIFCYLTNTPCIVLSNYNYKVEGVYQWLKDNCNYIIFEKNIDNLKNDIETLLNNKVQNNNCTFNFDELKKMLSNLYFDFGV